MDEFFHVGIIQPIAGLINVIESAITAQR